MDQERIGGLLKSLRKEKNITQEELAERLGVSNRSVSRWENGVTMPDFDILLELADYYDVEIREILEGKREENPMDKKEKDTLIQVADYTNEEKLRLLKRVHALLLVAVGALIVFVTLEAMGLADAGYGEAIASISLGLVCGMLIGGALLTSRYGARLRRFKRRLLKRGE